MEQMLIYVDMAGDYYHHVGLKEGKLIILDNDLEGYNCRVIESPFTKLDESKYFDFIIQGEYDLTYACSTIEEFDIDVEELKITFQEKVDEIKQEIEDLDKENYSIIEINDNPGYSINEWPYEGKGEKIGVAILKLLNLLPEE